MFFREKFLLLVVLIAFNAIEAGPSNKVKISIEYDLNNDLPTECDPKCIASCAKECKADPNCILDCLKKCGCGPGANEVEGESTDDEEFEVMSNPFLPQKMHCCPVCMLKCMHKCPGHDKKKCKKHCMSKCCHDKSEFE